jgi:hypothetical protein
MTLASSPRRVIRCIVRFLPFGRESAAGPGAVNLLAAAGVPRQSGSREGVNARERESALKTMSYSGAAFTSERKPL